MLRIRPAQMQAFYEARLPRFEDDMLAYLREFSPLHSRVLGPEGVRSIIRLGMARAGQYGFFGRGPVQLYIEMIFLFGVDFDTDPQFPWAGEILRDQTALGQAEDIARQSERADRLYDEVMAYLEAVGGPGREYARRALLRTRSIPLAAPPRGQLRFEDDLIEAMKDAYPEKFRYIGEAPLRALAARAITEGEKHRIATPVGISFLAGLMFALGHGIVADPKYPFIERTILNPEIKDPNKRVERTYSKVMIYLDHVLAHHGL
jgi:hypothetical protein